MTAVKASFRLPFPLTLESFLAQAITAPSL
jgi:hypothetical protein